MKIGILTGGGDCPGLNAVIRAIVRKSLNYGWECIGIENGWKGLVEIDTTPLDLNAVSGILQKDVVQTDGTVIDFPFYSLNGVRFSPDIYNTSGALFGRSNIDINVSNSSFSIMQI